MTLLAVYVAVVGTISYNTHQDDFLWHPIDFIFLAIGLAGACVLCAVPFLATQPAESAQQAKLLMEKARYSYLAGMGLAILCILGNLARDIILHHAPL